MSIDERSLTKGHVRKLNALRKSIGNALGEQAFAKWLKGGSWFDCLSYGCGLSAPTFNRSFFTPEVKNNSFGFRCAKTP